MTLEERLNQLKGAAIVQHCTDRFANDVPLWMQELNKKYKIPYKYYCVRDNVDCHFQKSYNGDNYCKVDKHINRLNLFISFNSLNYL